MDGYFLCLYRRSSPLVAVGVITFYSLLLQGESSPPVTCCCCGSHHLLQPAVAGESSPPVTCCCCGSHHPLQPVVAVGVITLHSLLLPWESSPSTACYCCRSHHLLQIVIAVCLPEMATYTFCGEGRLCCKRRSQAQQSLLSHKSSGSANPC